LTQLVSNIGMMAIAQSRLQVQSLSSQSVSPS
jgi:hypothetical protein